MENNKENRIKLLENRIKKSELTNSNFPKIYLWKKELKELKKKTK